MSSKSIASLHSSTCCSASCLVNMLFTLSITALEAAPEVYVKNQTLVLLQGMRGLRKFQHKILEHGLRNYKLRRFPLYHRNQHSRRYPIQNSYKHADTRIHGQFQCIPMQPGGQAQKIKGILVGTAIIIQLRILKLISRSLDFLKVWKWLGFCRFGCFLFIFGLQLPLVRKTCLQLLSDLG